MNVVHWRNAIAVTSAACLVALGYVSWRSNGGEMTTEQTVSVREPCQVKDIQIRAWKATIENRCTDQSCNYIKVVGDGSNECAHATAVKVRIVAKDVNGQIVDSVERSLLNTR